MTWLDREYGVVFGALAWMRTTASTDVERAELPRNTLSAAQVVALAILTSSISVLDGIRILLEHGYSDVGTGVLRTLYESEIDVSLIASDDELVHYYSDFEVWDVARNNGLAIDLGLIPDTEVTRTAITRRRADLRAAFEQASVEVPSDLDGLTLLELATRFAKARWNNSRPLWWFPGDRRAAVEAVARVQARILEPNLSESDEDHAHWLLSREVEHQIAYPEMSAHLHASPRVIAQRWPDFRIGGTPQEGAEVASRAAIHFIRIHHVACHVLEVPFDGAAWLDALRRADTSTA